MDRKREYLIRKTLDKRNSVNPSRKEKGKFAPVLFLTIVLVSGLIAGLFFVNKRIEVNKAVKLENERTESLKKEGIELYDIGKYREADDALLEYLKKRPKDVNCILLRGKSLYNSRNFSHADYVLSQGLRIDPYNKEMFKYRIKSMLKMKKYDLALDLFRSYSSLKFDAEDLMNKGIALYYEYGRYKEAEKPLKESLALDNKNIKTWVYLGKTLNRKGRNKEALKAYNNAFILKPDVKDNTFILDYSKQNLICGNFDKARDLLKRVDEDKNIHRIKKVFLQICISKAYRRKYVDALEKKFLSVNDLYYDLEWSCYDISKWASRSKMNRGDKLYINALIKKFKKEHGYERVALHKPKLSEKELLRRNLKKNLYIVQKGRSVRQKNGKYYLIRKKFEIVIKGLKRKESVQIFVYNTDEMFKKYKYPLDANNTVMYSWGSGLAMSVKRDKRINIGINRPRSHYYIGDDRRINRTGKAIIRINAYRNTDIRSLYVTLFTDYNHNNIIETNEISNIVLALKS